MQKERAASALKHGLPVPTPLPTRTRGRDVTGSRQPTSGTPYSRSPSSAPGVRRMPVAVKLLGVGLLLLGAVYGLTVIRDHRSLEPERARVPGTQQPAAQPNAAAALLPEPASAPLK
ncbi:MAG: hypothetical protein ABI548_13000 [Polyangiaceae bacterium]